MIDSRVRRSFVRVAAVVAALSLASCGSCADQWAISMNSPEGLRILARQSFSTKTDCPPERVTVVPRPDVPRPPPPAPPPEVASDPERLAYWREQNAVELDAAASAQVFEFTGCGQHRVALCKWDTLWEGDRVYPVASCRPIEKPGASTATTTRQPSGGAPPASAPAATSTASASP